MQNLYFYIPKAIKILQLKENRLQAQLKLLKTKDIEGNVSILKDFQDNPRWQHVTSFTALSKRLVTIFNECFIGSDFKRSEVCGNLS